MNRNETLFYRTKNRKIHQRIWVCVICKKHGKYNKYEKCFLDTATKTKLVALKTATKQQENS